MKELNIPDKCKNCPNMLTAVETLSNIREEAIENGIVANGGGELRGEVVSFLTNVVHLDSVTAEDMFDRRLADVRKEAVNLMDWADDGAVSQMQEAIDDHTNGCTGPVVLKGRGRAAVVAVSVCDSPSLTGHYIGHIHHDETVVVNRTPRLRLF